MKSESFESCRSQGGVCDLGSEIPRGDQSWCMYLCVVVAIGAHEDGLAIPDGEAVVVLPGLAQDPEGLLPDRRRHPAAVVRAGLVGVVGSGAPVVRARPVVADLVGDVDDVAVAPGAVGRRGSVVVVAAVGRWRRVAAVGITGGRGVAVGWGRRAGIGIGVVGGAAVGGRGRLAVRVGVGVLAGVGGWAAAVVGTVVVVAVAAVAVVVVVGELHGWWWVGDQRNEWHLDLI